MLLGETNINGITSFLLLIDGKLTGYQIIGWQKYPLDASVFNELRKLQLSNNYKVIAENEYKVILDLDTGYKHYFKDNQENLAMFYEMNGKDVTFYQGKGKSKLRRKIGCAIFVSFAAFVTCIELGFYFNSLATNNRISSISTEEISEYIMSSNHLNEAEKRFLNNNQLFSDLLPYINKNPNLVEKLRHILYNIDIQCEEKGKNWNGIAGYNDGTNILHVIGYEEDHFDDFKNDVDHEFCHDFGWGSKDFNYLMEAITELLASEYFDRSVSTYKEPVKILKCLMEMVGVEPVLESYICGNPCYLYDILLTFLTDEEIALFSLDKRFFDYTDEENNIRYEKLVGVLEKLYQGMYGDDMWNNNMIASIMNDLDYERYYFNSEKINNIAMYASQFDHQEKYSLDQAIEKGFIHPYIERIEKVSLEEWEAYEGDKNLDINLTVNGCIKSNKYIRILEEDGTYYDLTFREAIEGGYATLKEASIIYKDPVTDLNAPNIKYELEDNCQIEGYFVFVTVYEKEYVSPIQNKANMLN